MVLNESNMHVGRNLATPYHLSTPPPPLLGTVKRTFCPPFKLDPRNLESLILSVHTPTTTAVHCPKCQMRSTQHPDQSKLVNHDTFLVQGSEDAELRGCKHRFASTNAKTDSTWKCDEKTSRSLIYTTEQSVSKAASPQIRRRNPLERLWDSNVRSKTRTSGEVSHSNPAKHGERSFAGEENDMFPVQILLDKKHRTPPNLPRNRVKVSSYLLSVRVSLEASELTARRHTHHITHTHAQTRARAHTYTHTGTHACLLLIVKPLLIHLHMQRWGRGARIFACRFKKTDHHCDGAHGKSFDRNVVKLCHVMHAQTRTHLTQREKCTCQNWRSIDKMWLHAGSKRCHINIYIHIYFI